MVEDRDSAVEVSEDKFECDDPELEPLVLLILVVAVLPSVAMLIEK